MRDTEERIVSLHAGYTAGNDFVDAYVARPVDGTPRPGVILLSGMFGLAWTQRQITRAYARAGFVALSPDFLDGQRPRSREEALHVKNSLDVNRAVEHIAAGADFLRSLPWVGPEGRIGAMGFCLGGGLVLLTAARTDKLQAAVVYHQSLFPDFRELETIVCPLLCHYGTDDLSTPREEVDAFTRALDGYQREYEVHWYEGMGHSFAQITPDADVPAEQREAADLSLQRTVEFLWRELGSPVGALMADEPTMEVQALENLAPPSPIIEPQDPYASESAAGPVPARATRGRASS